MQFRTEKTRNTRDVWGILLHYKSSITKTVKLMYVSLGSGFVLLTLHMNLYSLKIRSA